MKCQGDACQKLRNYLDLSKLCLEYCGLFFSRTQCTDSDWHSGHYWKLFPEVWEILPDAEVIYLLLGLAGVSQISFRNKSVFECG